MKTKTKNKEGFKAIFKNNMFLLRFMRKETPLFFYCTIIEFIRHSLIVFLQFVIGFNYVLECMEFGRSFKEAATVILLIFAVEALSSIFNTVYWQKIKEKAMPKLQRALKERLYAKAREIDLSNYDDPKYYNDYILAVSEAGAQIERAFNLLSKLCSGLTAIICTSALFILKNPISFLFIAVSFVSTMYAGKVISKLNFNIRIKKNPHERKRAYVNRVFYLADYAKEMRLNTEVSEILLKDFDETNDEILNLDKKYANKRMGLEFLKNYICGDFIIDFLYLSYLIFNAAVLGTISFSSVVVMRWAAANSNRNLRELTEVYQYAIEISLYMEKIHTFLDTKPTILSTENKRVPVIPSVIELRDVSFGYSKKGGRVLKNINMLITPFSKTAIVGYNGAGKTTLIKLIMRLYDPDKGEILLDGVNIKEYDLEDYRRRIGTVFQDFKIFAGNIKENVILDDAENSARYEGQIISAIKKSGFGERLQTLPNGLDTNLTSEFEDDGINLSGGEGQRLAISRVFYREAALMILDEPSSALDPIAEYHLNRSMMTAAENKSVLFISHRLSTTRIADRIYMLENGEIIEEGNHGELVKKGGKYAEMWRVQAGQYA